MADPPHDALLDDVAALAHQAHGLAEVRTLAQVPVAGRLLPVQAICLGSTRPEAPAVGLFGGVHGLERIGTELVLACASTLLRRLRWDHLAEAMLAQMRVVFVPLVNPGGLLLGTRANPQGVDLMRNAPVHCSRGAAPWLGGQRLSAMLPWYRGPEGQAMQPEAQALCSLVQQELMPHAFALAVDCHSGFGLRDRLWLPWAHSRRPPPGLADYEALTQLMDETLAHHRYVVEPQSRHYLAHGDLWDHLLLQADSAARSPSRPLLPLTLEMGSWLWVKKNPRQVFSRQGLFNPLIAHRQQRVLRRHLGLLDFLMRATLNHARWRPQGPQRVQRAGQALSRWYPQEAP